MSDLPLDVGVVERRDVFRGGRAAHPGPVVIPHREQRPEVVLRVFREALPAFAVVVRPVFFLGQPHGGPLFLAAHQRVEMI
jgi:hypothetical protein